MSAAATGRRSGWWVGIAVAAVALVGCDSGDELTLDDDRVIGLAFEGEVLAISLNILWWHEIVNLRVGDLDLAVTHCPLTGSSLAFDRSAIEGAELGVSGLLYMNNLLMYDRSTNASLWPQMLRGARCGTRDGTRLGMVPIIEITWTTTSRTTSSSSSPSRTSTRAGRPRSACSCCPRILRSGPEE